MNHIAFAVIAAAALAVIGPHISQGNLQPRETAARGVTSVRLDYRATPPQSQTEATRPFSITRVKPY
jgi:hypothetical protein